MFNNFTQSSIHAEVLALFGVEEKESSVDYIFDYNSDKPAITDRNRHENLNNNFNNFLISSPTRLDTEKVNKIKPTETDDENLNKVSKCFLISSPTRESGKILTFKEHITELAEILKAEEDKSDEVWKSDHDARIAKYKRENAKRVSWKGVQYVNCVEDIPMLYGRQYKGLIEKFYSLRSYIKKYTAKFENNVVGLPQTSKELQEYLGTNQSGCAKIIQKAISAGILKECSKDYTVGKDSKHYYYNRKKLDEINSLKAQTLITEIKPTEAEDEILNNKVNNFLISIPVHFSAKLDLPGEITDEQIKAELCKTYKHFDEFIKINAENNELSEAMFGTARFNSKFEPKIERELDKNSVYKLNAVKIRATNSICNIAKESDEYSREDLLKDTFGDNKIYEFDVKSSIYRITYWLNHGVWLDNDQDLYQMMCPWKFESKEERDAFKTICMSLYFNESGPLAYKALNFNALIAQGYKKKDKFEVNKEIICELYDNMRNVIGKTYGGEIYYYESSMYILLMNKLLKAGYKVIQVYDGFYCDEPIEEFCLKNLTKCVEEYMELVA